MATFRMVLGAAAVAIGISGASVSQANAGDHNAWSGIYIGASAGWVGSSIDWTYRDPTGGIPDRPIGSADSDGFIAGGHVGIQHQMGQFVFGVEGSLGGIVDNGDWGRRSCFNPAFDCDNRLRGAVVTLGGRLGWAPSEHWLLFVSGGGARASVQTREVNVATGLENQFGTRDSHWEFITAAAWNMR